MRPRLWTVQNQLPLNLMAPEPSLLPQRQKSIGGFSDKVNMNSQVEDLTSTQSKIE